MLKNKFTEEDVERFVAFLNLVDSASTGYSFSRMNEVLTFSKELNWAGSTLKQKMEDNILQDVEVKSSKSKSKDK